MSASPFSFSSYGDHPVTHSFPTRRSSDLAGYTVSDPVPTGTSYVSSSAGCGFDSVNNKVDCSAASLGYNVTATVTFGVHVSPRFANRGTLTYTATLSAEGTAHPAHGHNSSTSRTAVNSCADVAHL